MRSGAALLALLVIVLPSQAAIADQSLEKKVKAAFLYKFGSYVEWPSTSFASAESPFGVCVLDGDADFTAALKTMVQSEHIHGHPVVVRELHAATSGPDCHILYLGTSDPQLSTEAIKAVEGKNVLTVSDNSGQGIISFLIADNRVRFTINDKAAADNGLVISSKLLDLAVNVTRRNQGAGQ
ncbi:MAG TPA: YfiR family protein [Methylophilaceae bacterium]|nr:YfiR family protein [Methylophilaceae bacterium]